MRNGLSRPFFFFYFHWKLVLVIMCTDHWMLSKVPGVAVTQVNNVHFLLHFFFFFRFPFLWLLSSGWSVFSVLWLAAPCLWSLDHSLCSCRSKSGVSSPSLTRRPARELFIPSSELLCSLGTRLLLACCLPTCVCKVLATAGSLARMRRVMFRTPCWMVWSRSCWISRTSDVSGNMSMKR